ncbi:MAG TPA: hypothetical protein VL284_11875 [Thermoanaerobaculia bacterium]|nr:hypothetical protein [Thermoanaerobaculia bacterium]
MKEFRGPLPLDERDFAEVRKQVLAKIEKRRAPIAVWALAAAAAIALVFVLVPVWRRAPAPAAVPAPLETAAPAPPRVPASLLARRAATDRPEGRPAHTSAEPRSVPPAQIASAGAPPSDEQITMNIQTADPNVRIIWISR